MKDGYRVGWQDFTVTAVDVRLGVSASSMPVLAAFGLPSVTLTLDGYGRADASECVMAEDRPAEA